MPYACSNSISNAGPDPSPDACTNSHDDHTHPNSVTNFQAHIVANGCSDAIAHDCADIITNGCTDVIADCTPDTVTHCCANTVADIHSHIPAYTNTCADTDPYGCFLAEPTNVSNGFTVTISDIHP